MTNAKVSRRSSSRWNTLLKTDCPRAIDHWISYFGELPPRRGHPDPSRMPRATLRT
jgi:hypothetical protein